MPSEMVLSAPRSPGPRSYTPPDSPRLRPYPLDDTLGRLGRGLESLIDKIENLSVANKPEATQPQPADAAGAATSNKPKIRASKLEYKRVDEIWDEKAYKYQIITSSTPSAAVEELDEYVFVVRERIDRNSMESTFYIDIKSEALRDVLRAVLRNINGISVGEDKLTIERNLIFNYLPELEEYRRRAADDASNSPTRQNHLGLLIEHLKKDCVDTTNRLNSLLKSGKITYDLLWALFKSNTIVYTTCVGTLKPRCVVFDYGEEKTRKNETKYYGITCHYLDFDGDVFGEATIELAIPKFRGAVRIGSLKSFPLCYLPDQNAIKVDLISCGKKFVSLIGSHHRHCHGAAFTLDNDGNVVKLAVNSRIMVDAAFFRKINPNYSRPRVSEVEDTKSENYGYFDLFEITSDAPISHQIKNIDLDPTEMGDRDLLICCPTVPGFSLEDKIWGEFAVADIRDIEWSSDPYNCLEIPDDHREVLMALAESHMDKTFSASFDDFVAGKGKGLNVLLHGSPGLGKTLTAEAVSEHLKRPLYSISAGEMSLKADELELQLSRIFEIAIHWGALLLLDETDVYLERRSTADLVRNGLVSVFLRKLEYCQGIMFMTTNRASEFDEAILSRIHLMLRYEDLDTDAKTGIWGNFLQRARTPHGEALISKKDFERLKSTKFNGRQIKNIVATAHALATKDKSRVTYLHLCKAVKASEKFIREFTNADYIDRMFS